LKTVALAAAAVLVLAAVFLIAQTLHSRFGDQADLTIAAQDQNAGEVLLLRNGKLIATIDSTKPTTVKLPHGSYQLEPARAQNQPANDVNWQLRTIYGPGSGDQFTEYVKKPTLTLALGRGDRFEVTILSAAPAVANTGDGFVPLFNGRD